jgi:hypothetical protein
MMWRPHPGWALSSDASASTLPLNTERGIEFETPLFKGVAHMWVAGLPDSPGKQRMQVSPVSCLLIFRIQARIYYFLSVF